MISAVATLFAIVLLALNPGASCADSSLETVDETASLGPTQCKTPDVTLEEVNWDELTVEATNRVYCQFRIFCPAEHRCCNAGPTFWCCPLPSTCDPNMDDDEWTGCLGAHGVNPL